ncbi:MAG: polysaccharide deacetylase family protein [Clostridiales bacterium]|jgi:peptidoglycan/xylan/chitin deacetylase (PgdA/CDA1 family)|nr:polysaccharide deacetylase family protein [Clostridiales bacterium]
MKKLIKTKIFTSILVIISIIIVFTPTKVGTTADVRVPIILYHNITEDYNASEALVNITPAEFETHIITLIESGYNPIDFDEYYDFVTNGKVLPNKPVIITFDDGYLSNYTYAFPILKKHNVKATIFAVTDTIGRSEGVNFAHFTWEQAREMEASGIIDIESHSDSHANLGEMSINDVQREFRRSKYLIEKNLNKDCNVFAFPYGGYSSEVQELGIKAGYKVLSLVGDVGANSAGADLTALRRITIRGTDSPEDLINTIEINLDK